MNCPRCSDLMIKARVSERSEAYDYCRNCKKELRELIDVKTDKANAGDFSTGRTAAEHKVILSGKNQSSNQSSNAVGRESAELIHFVEPMEKIEINHEIYSR